MFNFRGQNHKLGFKEKEIDGRLWSKDGKIEREEEKGKETRIREDEERDHGKEGKVERRDKRRKRKKETKETVKE